MGTSSIDHFDGISPAVIARIEAAGGRVLDPKPRFLDATGQRYMIQADGVALYCDSNHLTKQGARMLLLPFLRGSLILDSK
jgi:hypothetical protein